MARASTKENKSLSQKTRDGLKLTRETASELLETLQLWSERMLATGQSIRNSIRRTR